MSRQFIINPEPDLRPYLGCFLTKPFGVTSAEVVINCPEYVPLGRHLNSLCFSDKLIPPLAVDMFIPENQWELRKIPLEIDGDNTYVVDGSFEIRRCQNHRTESIKPPGNIMG